MKNSSLAQYLLATIAMMWLGAAFASATWAARDNLLMNSDVSAGSAIPNHWRPTGAPCESFQWLHPQGQPGVLQIEDTPAGYAAWGQSIELSSDWYYLSADLRTEGLARAFLAMRMGAVFARTFFTAHDWQRGGFYIHVPWNAHVQIQCGLASSGAAAKASFRDIRLNRLPGRPPPGTVQSELQLSSNPLPDDATLRRINLALICGLVFVALAFYLYAGPIEPMRTATHVAGPRAAVIAIFGVLLLTFLVLSHLEWTPGKGFSLVTPAASVSDEPQYVLLMNSLLFDHDLQLQDDYERVANGGLDAGVHFAYFQFDHHSIIVNRVTGQHALASMDASDPPSACDPRFNNPEDVYEAPAHPPAFSALIAAAIAPLRPSLAEVESDAALVFALIGWLGALLTYLTGRRLAMSPGKAMMAVLLLVFASPWLPYSRSFFPESTVGLVLIATLLAFNTDHIILAGLGAAFAAILKPPFAVIGAGFVISEFVAGRRRNALKLLMTLTASGAALVAFNYYLARTPVISGDAGLSSFHFVHLYNTFLDPEHGLFYFAPWTIVSFLAIPLALRSDVSDLKIIRQMILPIALFAVILSSNGPGLSYGPRYWVAFMPWFALATVRAMERAKWPAVAMCALLVLLGTAIAVPGALRYRELFSKPPWSAWKDSDQAGHNRQVFGTRVGKEGAQVAELAHQPLQIGTGPAVGIDAEPRHLRGVVATRHLGLERGAHELGGNRGGLRRIEISRFAIAGKIVADFRPAQDRIADDGPVWLGRATQQIVNSVPGLIERDARAARRRASTLPCRAPSATTTHARHHHLQQRLAARAAAKSGRIDAQFVEPRVQLLA